MPRPNLTSLAMVLGGLFALLIGLFTVSMCDCGHAIWGALAGAIAGVLIALWRKMHRTIWLATGGAMLLFLGMVLVAAGYGVTETDDPITYLQALFIGGGLGLLVDGMRRRPAPTSETPP